MILKIDLNEMQLKHTRFSLLEDRLALTYNFVCILLKQSLGMFIKFIICFQKKPKYIFSELRGILITKNTIIFIFISFFCFDD